MTILPSPTPTRTQKYDSNTQGVDVYNAGTESIDSLIYRLVPIFAGGFRGWQQFGSFDGSGGGWFNPLVFPFTAIIASSSAAYVSNKNQFTFKTMQVKFLAAAPPFNLTTITINGQNILLTPVAIAANGVFVDVVLTDTDFTVLANSTFGFTTDSAPEPSQSFLIKFIQ